MEVRKVIVTMYDLLCMLLGKVCMLGTVIFTIIVAVIKSDISLAIGGICVGVIILRFSYRSTISKDLYINGIYEFEIKKQQRQERKKERQKKKVKYDIVYKTGDLSESDEKKDEDSSGNVDESSDSISNFDSGGNKHKKRH